MIRRMMGLSWMCTGSVSQLAFGFAEPQRGLARSKALIVMGESPGEIESSAGQQQLLFRHRFELFWHGAGRHWDLRDVQRNGYVGGYDRKRCCRNASMSGIVTGLPRYS